MICQFTVKNYKSIKEEITLDMQATSISEHTDSIITDKDGEAFLPLAVLYGPNGGGKSNVIDALHNLLIKVMNPIYVANGQTDVIPADQKGKTIPYKFSKSCVESPTEFELFFRTDAAEYKYCLYIRNEQVVYESLDRRNIEGLRYTALLERGSDEEGSFQLKGDLKKLKADEVSDNLPLLSYLGITYKRNEIIKDVITWFEKKVEFMNYGSPLIEMQVPTTKSIKLKSLVLKMIKELDLDIEDYRVVEDNKKTEIYTLHKIGESNIELKLNEESSGTRKIFGVIPYIADSLLGGKTLIIDELDAKMHPQLLKYIISLYRDTKVNKNGAQLIYTSHDLSTMNSELFRRDEIWFVAKGNAQDSKIYSLVEFKTPDGKSVRKDARFDKQYLEGKYGADPYLRRIINWEEVNA